MKDFFPLGLAMGEAFCNRVSERDQLQRNIEKCRHILISSPRRYGKSSLVNKVLNDFKLPYEKIDLSLVITEESVRDYILFAIQRLLTQLQPSYKKAYEIAKQLLSNFKPKLIIDEDIGARIELTYQKKDNPLTQITESLLSLDIVAKKTKKRAVIFIDEFQQIATLENHETVEAAIRSAAQELQMITLIFSGSNRKLLLMMFDDKKRPFFQLCEKIFLERISMTDYTKHLQKIAKKRWGSYLLEEAMATIFQLTECHPYYLNLLCNKVWNIPRKPDAQAIKNCWHHCLQDETHLLSQTLISLSPTQRAFLLLLLEEKIDQPSSKNVVSLLKVTPRAVIKAVNSLMDNDYIYKDYQGHYQLVNPLLKYYLELNRRLAIKVTKI